MSARFIFCQVTLLLLLSQGGCEEGSCLSRVLYGPSKPIPPQFFGLHIHQAGRATPWPPFPVHAWRLWDAEVTWNFIQPQAGQWNFELLDQYVDLAARHHSEILLTFGYTPRWAASRPDEVSSSKMLGVASHPSDLRAWSEYVRTIATRYKGKIHVYEIWNEANLPGYYSGTVSQMATLSKAAYKILKEVDRENIVVSPAAQGGGANVRWLDHFLSQGGDRYCDVIGYHFYVTPKPPEVMLKTIGEVKQSMERHGVVKPIWNTESGWSMDKTFLNDDERMGYVARAFILAWAAGIERFYWYAYDNYTWTSLPLTLPDRQTPNAAGIAYATLQSWLINSRLKSCAADGGYFWTCILSKADGSTAWIMWASGADGVRSLPDGCCNNMEVQYLDGRSEMRGRSKSVFLGSAPILIEEQRTSR